MIDNSIEIEDFDFNELEVFDFDMESFDMSIEIDISKEQKTRYIKPPKNKEIEDKYLKYSYAVNLAKEISLMPNERIYAIVNGTFVFGDLIEALLTTKQVKAKEMTISTLSLNLNNIDSLANLLRHRYIDKLNLIVSDYFYSHERRSLIPYIYENLDIDNKFQLAVCSTHCKICIFETDTNQYITIHGSANLRSSSNIEQIMIENNKELYEFNNELHKSILEKYKTINKSIRGKQLWQAVQLAEVAAAKAKAQ